MEGNFSVSLKCRISRKLYIGLGVSTRSQTDRRTRRVSFTLCRKPHEVQLTGILAHLMALLRYHMTWQCKITRNLNQPIFETSISQMKAWSSADRSK